MERKTFHALLLSVAMVTGAVTISDAYAQEVTNTDRLIEVIATTDDTNEMVSDTKDMVSNLAGLWSNFEAQFTPLSQALQSIASTVSAISADVSTVEGKVSDLAKSVDALAQAESERATSYQSSIDGFEGAVMQLEDKIDSMGGEDGTAGSLDEISGQITSLSTQINQFLQVQDALTDDVEEIKTALGNVQTSVDTTVGPPPTSLVEGTAKKAIPLSWHARGLTEVPSDKMYTAEFQMTCDADVFVESVTSDINDHSDVTLTDTAGTDRLISNPIFDEVGNDITDPRSDTTLTVNGQTLFDSTFDIGADNDYVFEPDEIPLNLMELKKDAAIQFETTTTVPPSTAVTGNTMNALELYVTAKKNTAIAAYFAGNDAANPVNIEATNSSVALGLLNVTKAALGSAETYMVTVEYFSANTKAKCEIELGTDAPLDNTQTVLVPLQPMPGSTSILSEYSGMVGCDLNPVSVTNVTAQLSNAPGLNNYVDMELMVGDDTKAEFTFVNGHAVIMNNASLPFEFSGADLTIKGNIVSGASILAQITYNTIKGVECTAN